MNDIIIRKAIASDIDSLIRIRISFLNSGDFEPLSDIEQSELTDDFKDYLLSHLNKDFIAYIALDGDEVVSSIFLAINKRNAIPPFISENYAILTNVYTYPSYRKHGIATRMMKELISSISKHEIACIELTANEVIVEFYQKFGFDFKELYGQIMCLCL